MFGKKLGQSKHGMNTCQNPNFEPPKTLPKLNNETTEPRKKNRTPRVLNQPKIPEIRTISIEHELNTCQKLNFEPPELRKKYELEHVRLITNIIQIEFENEIKIIIADLDYLFNVAAVGFNAFLRDAEKFVGGKNNH